MIQCAGITVTQGWSTANFLETKVELDNTIAQGLKAEVLNFFSPESGNRGQKLSVYFKQPSFHLRSFFDLKPAGNVHAVVDGVIGHEGFLVGGEAGYDVQKAAITRYSAAVGYSTPLYSASVTATNNLSIYSAAYYQKINPGVEFGAKASMDSKTPQTIGLELATKYKVDPLSFAKVNSLSILRTTFVRRTIVDILNQAKINDRGIASLAYNTKLNSGLTFGIGASLDTQKLNEAGHKVCICVIGSIFNQLTRPRLVPASPSRPKRGLKRAYLSLLEFGELSLFDESRMSDVGADFG